MTPDVIAGIAALNGLDLIALTDHNCALNCHATKEACDNYGISFIAGVEVTTAEDVHIVSLFPSCDDAVNFSNELSSHLPPIKNKEKIFGNQLVADINGATISTVENLLIMAVSLNISQCVKLAEKHGGFSFPAHVEKDSNSILAILGGFPQECDFPLIEVKNMDKANSNPLFESEINGRRVISSSDAHYPHQITQDGDSFLSDGSDFYSVRKALMGY